MVHRAKVRRAISSWTCFDPLVQERDIGIECAELDLTTTLVL